MHVMGGVSPDGESGSTGQPLRSPDHRTPPPPPPPPPILPGLGAPAVGQKKKRRVRSFFWKTIPEDQVKGRANLWTQGGVRQQYQIDVRTVEELFGQSERQPSAEAPPGTGSRARASFREAKEETSILDSKRGMNVGIFLKQFKRPSQAMIEDLHHGNSEAFGAEPLKELLKLLPEAEEVTRLTSYHGDASKLPLADSFMHMLVQLPSYRLRIESMLLKEEFPAAAEAMNHDLQILRSAVKELMRCEELHAVLHLVLQAGNILNAGGYGGAAVGFKLASLLSLADTKANKPGMNLMHFVALEAQKKDHKLLEFPIMLRDVPAAARVSVETLDTELQWLTSRTRSVEESVRGDAELLQQLDHFLQHSAASLSALHDGRQRLREEGNQLLDFFCEDRDSFRLDDCFNVFHTFCSRFTQAAKENREREMKEAARRRRVEELEEQKRHSWAGGEEVGGAFGFRYGSETDMSAAVSRHENAGLLVELLAANPLGRSGSLRRSRNSPSSSLGVAAERQLSTFLETSNKNQKVLPVGPPSPEPGLVTSEVSNVGLSKMKHVAATYLSKDNVSRMSNSAKSIINNSTSNSKQQCDPNSNGREGVASISGPIASRDGDLAHSAAMPTTISISVEKCILVPELKGFEKNLQPGNLNRVHCSNLHQGNSTICDLDREKSDQLLVLKVVDDSQHSVIARTSGLRLSEGSSFQMEEDEGQNEKVAVWCVTGMCEANSVAADREKDHCNSDDLEAKPGSSTSAHRLLSETQPANEKPLFVPISSQPVAVARGHDPSLTVPPPKWHPAERASAGVMSDLDAPEEDKPRGNPGEEATSTKEKTDSATVPEQPTDERTPRRSTRASLTDGRSEQATPSKLITKNLSTFKTGPSGLKPAAWNTTGRSKSVRTLTSFESQGMRRVVPISKNSRGTPSTRMSCGATVPTTATTLHTSSSRRGDRPATVLPSERYLIQKTPHPKDSKHHVIGGPKASPQDCNLESQRKYVRKALTKAKPEPEEKMCRSTLRALSQAPGNSISAPATPLHKASTPALSQIPGFARSTAASSFRQTHLTIPLPASPETPHTTSDSSSRAAASPPPDHVSSVFTQSRSLRVTSSSRSWDLNTSSTPLRRSQNIRSSQRSLPKDSPPKGKWRNDSGSSSDKSAPLRDSVKLARPSWR